MVQTSTGPAALPPPLAPSNARSGAARGGAQSPLHLRGPRACSPATAAAAYWQSVPGPVLWPVVVLATAAAIIASQALISGAFSIVQQVGRALPHCCP